MTGGITRERFLRGESVALMDTCSVSLLTIDDTGSSSGGGSTLGIEVRMSV